MNSWEIFSGSTEEWNDFVYLKDGNYRQIYEWGEYKSAIGWKVLRFIYRKEDNIKASVQITYKTRFFVNAIFIPGGINGDIAALNNEFFDLLKRSLETSFFYIRADFTKKHCVKDENLLINKGWSSSTYKTHSSIYCELDLKKTNEELLAEAKQKWRYHHKRSLKKQTHIVEKNIPSNFVSINAELAEQRNHENFYSINEVEPLINLLGKKLIISQAKDQNLHLTAVRSVIKLGNKAWHHYSAVNNKGRKSLAGYRIFMHLLDVLRDRGIEYFNIGELNQERWPGPYRFKLGIGHKSMIYRSLGEWEISSHSLLTLIVDFYIRLYLKRHGASFFNPKKKKEI